VWKEVIKSKYGELAVGKVNIVEECKPWYASLWWKDVCSIGTNLSNTWFANNVEKELGNGLNTSFWSDIWVGSLPLKEKFPCLFSISTQREATVADIHGSSENMHWNLTWRHRFFVWEEDLLRHLLDLITLITLSDAGDRWGWKPDNGDAFSVRSTFLLVSDFTVSALVVSAGLLSGLIVNWKSPAPPKVRAFAWQLLHDRIPTRVNLCRRQIIDVTGDLSCALCGVLTEDSNHLFIYCDVAMRVWAAVFVWLQMPFSLPHNLLSILHFLTHN
jgi:hypothetical protein